MSVQRYVLPLVVGQLLAGLVGPLDVVRELGDVQVGVLARAEHRRDQVQHLDNGHIYTSNMLVLLLM